MAPQKKCDNKKFKLIFILIQLSEMNGVGRVKVSRFTGPDLLKFN